MPTIEEKALDRLARILARGTFGEFGEHAPERVKTLVHALGSDEPDLQFVFDVFEDLWQDAIDKEYAREFAEKEIL